MRTYYARGNDSFKEDMTSAMQIVADRETPTRQWTNVADLSVLPFSVETKSVMETHTHRMIQLTDK